MFWGGWALLNGGRFVLIFKSKRGEGVKVSAAPGRGKNHIDTKRGKGERRM